MKHNTFLRKLPMIIGALTIILFALMAAKCPSSDKDDKKAAKLSFAEKNIKSTAATLGVTFKEDGGVTKEGEKGKEHYYVISTTDNTKPFLMPAVAAKSKGAITYKLKKFGLDDKGKIKLTDAPKEDGTVDKEGKVVIKNSKDGFYYLEASIAAKGDYKAASAKALLLVGSVPLPADAIVVKSAAPGSDGAKIVASKVVLSKDKKTITLDPEADKTFVVIAEIDHSKFPPEAPKATGKITLSDHTKGNDKTVANLVATKNSNSALVTSGTGNDNPSNVKIQAIMDAASPYAAISSPKVDVVTVKKK